MIRFQKTHFVFEFRIEQERQRGEREIMMKRSKIDSIDAEQLEKRRSQLDIMLKSLDLEEKEKSAFFTQLSIDDVMSVFDSKVNGALTSGWFVAFSKGCFPKLTCQRSHVIGIIIRTMESPSRCHLRFSST